jgi:hypothetical protein
MRLALLIVFAMAATACNALQPSGVIAQKSAAWREIVTEDDRGRLRDWRSNFAAALAATRKSGHSAEIEREGALLDPDAALGGGIPNGGYRCRVIKLGAKAAGNLDYVAYPTFTCRVQAERSLQRLTKLDGSQRYVGLIFSGDAMRGVFLGTLVLGDETQFLQYGQDETRDIAGYVERIGPRRWRLIMPKPHFESRLDVMELAPLSEKAR